jgi:hypothetical protein
VRFIIVGILASTLGRDNGGPLEVVAEILGELDRAITQGGRASVVVTR